MAEMTWPEGRGRRRIAVAVALFGPVGGDRAARGRNLPLSVDTTPDPARASSLLLLAAQLDLVLAPAAGPSARAAGRCPAAGQGFPGTGPSLRAETLIAVVADVVGELGPLRLPPHREFVQLAR